MYCKHCGKPIEDDIKFCPECGGVLREIESPPSPPSQPPNPVSISHSTDPTPPNRFTTKTIAILVVIAILIVTSIVVGIKVMNSEDEWEGAEVEVWIHTVTEYGRENVPDEPYVVEIWYSEGIIFHINISDTLDDWEDTPFKERVDWYSGTTGSNGKDVFYLTEDIEGFYLFILVAGTERWSFEEVWIDENVHEVTIGPLIQEVSD